MQVVAIISRRHSEASASKTRGKKLQDFADLVLDTGAGRGRDGEDRGVGDAGFARFDGGGVPAGQRIKAEVAELLTSAGHPPTVFSGRRWWGRSGRRSCLKGRTTSMRGGCRSCMRS